ncbi:MAG: hypothetical protein COA43_11150 [Robiginitomaculum sp.]|nr:MAG: hypothetical protein COA43_11150 [Robiginitomaculum sp.]
MHAPKLVTAPLTYPVDIADVKQHLRVGHADDDTLINGYIAAATGYLDGYVGILGRCLILQTWEQVFDAFSACMRLPLLPAYSIEEISYTNTAGDQETLAEASYEVLADALGAYVSILNTPSNVSGRVTITYIAGYGDETKVPAPIKAAIMLHVGSLYEVRERELVGVSFVETGTYQALIAPYRRLSI